ncbi:RNA-directed DNA polymerase, eukaryota [Tanacetum coccineum]
MAIRGILVEGVWIESPNLVKGEFFSHLANRFDKPADFRLHIEGDFPNKLSFEQQTDLEAEITHDEIKKAIWDCGVDKSPGDIVDDVQSAFVVNRQILDGSFILNEVFQWLDAYLPYVSVQSSFKGFTKDGICEVPFFNEADIKDKKQIWVKWNKALASKDNGGLGSSLWAKVIKGIHGKDGKIVPRGGLEEIQYLQLSKEMEEVSLIDTKDRWSWSLDGQGVFSIASVRKLIDDKNLPVVSSKTRWIKVVPIKVNILAWKIRLDCLPTRLNLSKRGIDIHSILCPICHKEVESSSHLFSHANSLE